MYLNIILTLLVITLITISTGIYIWWRKYGKELFNTITSLKTENPLNFPKNENINDIFSTFMKLSETLPKKK